MEEVPAMFVSLIVLFRLEDFPLLFAASNVLEIQTLKTDLK